MEATKTPLSKFIADNNIRMTATRADSNPNMPDSHDMDHWKCVLTRGKSRMTVHFSMGYGHNGKAPELSSVLSCLASDASGTSDNSFEEWARDLGFDPDSRKAERTYKACAKEADRLHRFLGADLYNQLLRDTEME